MDMQPILKQILTSLVGTVRRMRVSVQKDDGTEIFSSVPGKVEVTSAVQLTGSMVEEVLTQDDAVDDVLTFSENIYAIEIYHDEDGPRNFVVNGLTLPVGPGGWRSPVGGTPSDEVTIPADVNCVVSRLV